MTYYSSLGWCDKSLLALCWPFKLRFPVTSQARWPSLTGFCSCSWSSGQIACMETLHIASLCHQPKLARFFAFGVSRLSSVMKELVVWLPRETIYSSLPQQFRDHYPGTTCIIDCSEAFIGRPKNMRARAATYSNYKHHNTMKFLLAASPNGVIVYVSQCWGGRTSDKFLVNASQVSVRRWSYGW